MTTNYSRMKGPGDLPGDPTNPNSPDYDDLAVALEEEDREFWFGGLSAEKQAELLRDFIDGRKIGNTWLGVAFDAYLIDTKEWEAEVARREDRP